MNKMIILKNSSDYSHIFTVILLGPIIVIIADSFACSTKKS